MSRISNTIKSAMSAARHFVDRVLHRPADGEEEEEINCTNSGVVHHWIATGPDGTETQFVTCHEPTEGWRFMVPGTDADLGPAYDTEWDLLVDLVGHDSTVDLVMEAFYDLPA